MNTAGIKKIIRGLAKTDGFQHINLIETHISWIILTGKFAYKIKKPVRFSFLDFSTLALRKYYCDRELKLNQRLAKDVYLHVLPIRESGPDVFIGGDDGEIVDYCVQMRRLDNNREMKTLLEKGLLEAPDVEKIASMLAGFHKKAPVIEKGINAGDLQADFEDLIHQEDFISHYLGENAFHLVYNAIALSHSILQTHHTRILWRNSNGFVRDCHGDLHSGNIFVLDQPVIFDCIEFNDHFRQIDVLNEIAFFCMDLESYDRRGLSRIFITAYQKQFPSIFSKADENLLLYYKLYRANIKVKVNVLKAMQAPSAQQFNKRLRLTEQYMNLMKQYYRELSELMLPKTRSLQAPLPVASGGRPSQAPLSLFLPE